MKAKKIFLGSFLGALIAVMVSSSYFYTFFRKSVKKLDYSLDKWDDINSF